MSGPVGTGVLAGLAVSLAMAAPASAEQDETLIGRWHTASEGGVVEIARCGEALCGRLVEAAALAANPDQRDVRNRDAALRERPLHGLEVFSGFEGGPEVWMGGTLYDPDSGREVSRGALTLIEWDTLEVQGCVARLLCRTQTWRRAR